MRSKPRAPWCQSLARRSRRCKKREPIVTGEMRPWRVGAARAKKFRGKPRLWPDDTTANQVTLTRSPRRSGSRPTQYLPTLWSAIDAYQRGRHFAQSIALLQSYLRYEERRRQPRGLVAYGRALLAEGRPDEAMDALQTCIVEFERDPLRYDARLLAAQAAIDDNRVEQARLWLIDNLTDGELTPQSPTWRDSLFTLAETLFQDSEAKILEAEKEGRSEVCASAGGRE